MKDAPTFNISVVHMTETSGTLTIPNFVISRNDGILEMKVSQNSKGDSFLLGVVPPVSSTGIWSILQCNW